MKLPFDVARAGIFDTAKTCSLLPDHFDLHLEREPMKLFGEHLASSWLVAFRPRHIPKARCEIFGFSSDKDSTNVSRLSGDVITQSGPVDCGLSAYGQV